MLRRGAAILALVVGSLLAVAPAWALDASTLARDLARRSATLSGRTGALVRDLTTGATLYARAPGRALIPASNEKLYTTAAVLLRFGADARLVTTLRATAVPDADGVVRGDLVLTGAGDPSLGDAGLADLAADLRRAGVRRVSGRLLGDETLFDARRGSAASGWAPDSDIGGYLGGLTWAHGSAPTGRPARTAANRLRSLLAARHIRVRGGARTGTSPKATHTLGSWASPAMADLVAGTLGPSDNFYAETLLKVLGARFGAGGTTPSGLAVARTVLGRLGVHPTMTDGSGLSYANRTSPTQIVSLLAAMRRVRDGAAWREAMARPGVSGTLAGRMRGTAAVRRCRAKTGTLSDVSALSGYCTTDSGHVVAFAFIENGMPPYRAKAVEDRLLPLVARYAP